VHYCFQEKETGGFEENWCSTVFLRMFTPGLRIRKLVHVYFKENWCTTVFRRGKPMVYCFEKNWSTTVLNRKLAVYCFMDHVHPCSHEKETGGLLF